MPRCRAGQERGEEIRIASSDQTKPLHFAPEPATIHDQDDRSRERANRANCVGVGRRHPVDPQAPNTDAEREQRRKGNEDDVKTLE